jgi:hypothetical protein
VIEIKGAMCPYKRLPRVELLVDRSRIQVKDGPHCVLADLNNLYRHLQINNLWNMLEEISKHVICPHENGKLKM